VIEYEEYFVPRSIKHYHIPTLILLASAFYIGWKMEKQQWSSKLMNQVMEAGVLALLNYSKKLLVK
jgi:hypothetical protein